MRPSLSLERRRLAGFAALSLFVALTWVGMLAEPPLARAALSCLPVIAALTLLPRWRRLALPGWAASALAVAALLAASVVGLVLAGLPARLLAPTGWSELLAGIDLGFAGIGDGVSYPYGGPNEWSRLILLLGAPSLVGIAALLTFLPLGREPEGPRLAGLGVLVAGYGIAVTMYGPDLVLLRGIVLLLCVIGWLWLPTIERRSVLRGGALIALALIAAVPFTLRFDEGQALVNYRSWSWGTGGGTSFNWDHSYGPIDWERSGDTVIVVKSQKPNYWKATVLDRFDGHTWVRSESAAPVTEVPAVELTQDWFSRASVAVHGLRSTLIVGPGSSRDVTAGTEAEPSADGSLLFAREPLERGDAYEVRGYTPDPSAEQMRAAGWEVSERLAHMTSIDLPAAEDDRLEGFTTLDVRAGDGEEARAEIADSAYGRMAGLAERLTADAASAYDAVKAIESYLLDNYTYSESPPDSPLPLESFLFEDRIGYCQQFSGAMALMLRMEGIPARVATGFSPGIPKDGGRFVVRALDAHSWVEVYFEGIGWVPFDPTPASAPAELRNGGAGAASSAASSLGPLLEGLVGFGVGTEEDPGQKPQKKGDQEQDPAPAAVGGGGSGPTTWVAALLAAMLGGAGLLVGPGLWRQSRERGLGTEAAVGARIAELESALTRLEYRRQDDATLLALERSLRSRAEPLAARYIERLRRLRYGREPSAAAPSAKQRRALRRRLSERRGLAGRIAAYRAIPPFSPRR